ncbi:ubiquitin-specific protease doa4 [Basidiobolus ranarum]|uniref:Ubiquitin carboxyl-terminal hydrolase n=1 Tax=Basidiobolus ranarum TaxID=34480 RepID=A0ABR2VZ65_9FUNG
MGAAVLSNSEAYLAKLKKESVIQFDSRYPLKAWIVSADKLYNQAQRALDGGDLEAAYIYYLKATSIVVDYIPKHKEFPRYLKEDSYLELKKKILEAVPGFESVKLGLERELVLDPTSYARATSMSKIITPNPMNDALYDSIISNIGKPDEGSPISFSRIQPVTPLGGRSRPVISKPKRTLIGPNDNGGSSSKRSTSYSVPHTAVILPETLNEYLGANNPLSLLILDIRPKAEFLQAHIRGKCVINIEPCTLREEVTSSKIEATLVLSSQHKQDLFCDRSKFDLVIIYDKGSKTLDQRVFLRDGVVSESPLQKLVHALYDPEAIKRTKRKPVLLVGGFDAWWKAYGPSGCFTEAELVAAQTEKNPTNDSTNDGETINTVDWPMCISKRSPEHISSQRAGLLAKKLTKRSVISPALGRPISRNVLDYFQAQTPVPPPPMIKRSNSKPARNGLKLQFDYLKSNRKTPQPSSSVTSEPVIKLSNPTPPKPVDIQAQSNSASTNRNSTFLDNPYYGFTITKSQFGSPPTPRRPLPEIPSKVITTHLAPSPTHGMSLVPPVFESSVKELGSVRIGTTGLKNLGNTCFMNSILQCLSGTIPLARYFLDGSYKRHINATNFLGTGGVLAEAFGNLIRVMWSEQYNFVSPVTFREAIGRFASQFQGYEQQDAQELLAFLLDGLHEDLNLIVTKPPICDDDDDYLESLPEEEAANLAWEKYLLRNSSIIVGLFQGQFRSRLKCTFCQHTSTTYNAFMYLSLPIPKNKETVTLHDCLNEFVREEVLEGDDAWFCSKCKQRRRAIKSLTISRFPDVLLIHIKRFSFHGPFRDKLNNLVKYPLRDLDLTQYVPTSANRPTSHYDLFGVSNHMGGLSGGHYTAHIKNGYRGQWHYFDDSRVSVCEESKVMSKSAYILFYVRSSVN